MNLIKLLSILFLTTISLFSASKMEKVSLQLNWKYQFEFAGFIAAKEKGFYKDEGLDVDLKEYENGTNVIDEVKNQKVTFGVYDASYLKLYDSKKPIVFVANYFKRPALVLITNQDIVVPKDLIGKRVMYVKNETDDTAVGTLLKEHKISSKDFISVDHDFTAKKFINGEVDAFTAFVSNELYDVKKSKVPYRIMDPQSYGVRDGGLNLFTSYNYAINKPDKVNAFIRASKKGWEYALNNKKEIVDIIYNKYSKFKSKDALMFEADETEKLVMKDIYSLGEILEDVVIEDIKRFKKEYKNSDITPEKILFSKVELQNSDLQLTKEEKEYLFKKNKITMCIDPNWMPYEKIDENGNHIGMTSEYIPLLSKKIGIAIELVPTKTWEQSIEYAKARKCDIYSLAMKTPERSEYMNFTTPYIDFPLVMATTNDKLFITDPEALLTTEKIGIVKGYSMGELFKAKYPINKIVDVQNVEDGLSRVQSGELYGFAGALPTVAYTLQHKFIGALKITGKFDENFELGVGVRNDDLILYNIFEKTVRTISESMKQHILNKYISIKVEQGFNYKYLYEILGVIFILVLLGFIRNRQLTKYNRNLELKQKELFNTQKDLESSLQNFKKLFDSVNESVIVSENGICIDLNNMTLEMFGYDKKEEMIGKELISFVSSISKENFIRKMQYQDADAYEIILKKKNGEEFSVLAKGTNTVINSKNVRISTLIDLSELKHKDRLLFQQSKMAAMGEMIENIAHQWRQPLSLISSISTGIIVKKELGIVDDKQEQTELEKINQTSQHLSQTIEDFRNFFKKDKEKKLFSVLSSIQKSFMLIEGALKSNSIKLIYKTKDDAQIENFENELTQAILNIAYNAKDVLLKNSTSERFIFVDLKIIDRYIKVDIMDNGGGIEEEIMDKIFEPYFTTKHQSQGTGIGLYMTHQIIEKHMNGRILVKNSKIEYEGKSYVGAKFSILLPMN